VPIFFLQLYIKRPFKSPPQPKYASALPEEVKTHEIGTEMNKKCQKHP